MNSPQQIMIVGTRRSSVLGWAVVVGCATAALALGSRTLTPVVVALILGILVTNSPAGRVDFGPATTFLTKRLLRASVVALGAGINLGELGGIGVRSLIGASAGIIVAIAVSQLLGKAFGLTRRSSALIGIGTAICGASAILAAAPVLRAKDDEVALSLGAIFTFNAVALLAMPAIAITAGLSDAVIGVWAGLGVHDTAAAVSVGFAVSPESGELATLIKLARTLLLVPLLVLVSLAMGRNEASDRDPRPGVRVPMFVVGFVLAAIANSLGWLGDLGSAVSELGRIGVVFVVAGIGVTLKWRKVALPGRGVLFTALAASLVVTSTAFVSAMILT